MRGIDNAPGNESFSSRKNNSCHALLKSPTHSESRGGKSSDNTKHTKKNYMKKLVISAFASLALVAVSFAGQPVVSSKKGPEPEPCFADTEFQIDTFGSYTSANGTHGDGFGGGIGLNYFFTRNVGLGLDTNIYDGNDSAVWQFTGAVLLRYPLELGGLCLAPYAKLGGGFEVNGSANGYFTTGAGLEFRITPRVGVYGEGSYNWSDDDFYQIRTGIRWVF